MQHLRINQLLHLTTDFEFELPDFEFELGYLGFLLKNKFHLKNLNELPNLIRLIKFFHCTLVMKDEDDYSEEHTKRIRDAFR